MVPSRVRSYTLELPSTQRRKTDTRTTFTYSHITLVGSFCLHADGRYKHLVRSIPTKLFALQCSGLDASRSQIDY
jgi:hypothetical protein